MLRMPLLIIMYSYSDGGTLVTYRMPKVSPSAEKRKSHKSTEPIATKVHERLSPHVECHLASTVLIGHQVCGSYSFCGKREQPESAIDDYPPRTFISDECNELGLFNGQDMMLQASTAGEEGACTDIAKASTQAIASSAHAPGDDDLSPTVRAHSKQCHPSRKASESIPLSHRLPRNLNIDPWAAYTDTNIQPTESTFGHLNDLSMNCTQLCDSPLPVGESSLLPEHVTNGLPAIPGSIDRPNRYMLLDAPMSDPSQSSIQTSFTDLSEPNPHYMLQDCPRTIRFSHSSGSNVNTMNLGSLTINPRKLSHDDQRSSKISQIEQG